MSDMKVEQKQTLTRQQAARFLAALAQELEQDGLVTVALGSSTLEFAVAGQLDCELEVSVDGGQLELELELKWSMANRSSAAEAAAEEQSAEDTAAVESAGADSAEDASAADAPAEDEPADVTLAEDDVRGEVASAAAEPTEAESAEQEPTEAAFAETESTSDDSETRESPDAPAGNEDESAGEDVPGSGPSEGAAGSAETETVEAAKPSRSAKPRRARRSAAAPADKSSFNGVDQAAVRAWAAANGLTVSPRGRIKDEVIEAYRAAGN